MDSRLLNCKDVVKDCPTAPDVCTGHVQIDRVLKESNLGCKIGLNSLYTWDGFCTAVRQFNALGDRTLFLGDSSPSSCPQGLSNIAALLAQCMWESGGEVPWSACDENNYTNSATASCTQRSDGSLYSSL